MWFFNILPICVCTVGGYLTVRLRGFFLLRPLAVLREIRESLKREGAVSSLCLALAGTLGVGNIIGVGVGLIVGGAGSIFWLVISSLFATALKYSEACISTDISGGLGDGMIVSLRHSFKRLGKPLSILYAAVCLLLSLTMGGALQSVGASGAISSAFDLDEGKILLIFTAAAILLLLFFKGKIKWLTVRIIPLATLLYIALSLSAVVVNIAKLPDIISLIFKSVLNPSAIAGGGAGTFLTLQIREGFSRGLLSNEAGAGTSSLSHSEAGVTPSGAGVLGICEVLFDTVILCPLTALVILSAVPTPSLFQSGGELVIYAFETALGKGSAYAVSVCIFLFAFATVACWYYYGKICVQSLRIPTLIFTPLFFLSLLFAPKLGELLLVRLSDAFLLLLSILTGAVLIKNSDRLVYLSELSGLL